jgi:serine/threonine protein phosphatase PrpC
VAVRESVKQWAGREAPVQVLLQLVHTIWRARIAPYTASDCATTCLFAYAAPDGAVTCAQLGDGLIVLDQDEELVALDSYTGEFANETTGLGLARSLSEWSHRQFEASEPRSSLLLATDGVANDLKPGSHADMTHYLRDHYGPLDRRQRWRELTAELNDWATPGNGDDKTLAFLWQRLET